MILPDSCIEKEYDIDLEKLKKWYPESASSTSNAAGSSVYTAEEASAILEEQLILAYENRYGEFIPPMWHLFL